MSSVYERARRMSAELQQPIRFSQRIVQTHYMLDGNMLPVTTERNDKVYYEPYEWDLDVEIPINVEPLNNQWMLEHQADIGDVDEVLEGQLQGIQLSLQDYGQSPIAQEFGIESPLRPTAERLFSYLVLYDEYRKVTEECTEQAKKKREDYENEKAVMNTQKMSQGKRIKAIKQLQESQFPGIQAQQSRAQEATTIQQLILRKAVLEIFGLPQEQDSESSEYTTSSLSILPHALEEIHDIEDSNLQQNGERQLSRRFLQDLSRYVQTVKDPSLFQEFQYRGTPGLIERPEDCEVLDSIMTMNVDPSSLTTNQDIRDTLEILGGSMLTFLKNRATFLSNLQISQTPQLDLVHDLINTALFTGKPPVIQGLASTLDTLYRDESDKQRLNKEVGKVFNQYCQLLAGYADGHPEFITELQDITESLPHDLFRFSLPALPPTQELAEMFCSNTGRHADTLFALAGIDDAEGYDHPILRSKLLQSMNAQTIQHARKESEKYANDIGFNLLFRYASSFPHYLKYPPYGVSVTVGSSINSDLASLNTVHLPIVKARPDSTAGKLRDFQETYALTKSNPYVNRQDVLLNEYFSRFFHPEDIAQLEAIHIRENEVLWRKVLDEFEWFVSPRGDLFPADTDPEQLALGLDYIKFRMDRQYPREYAAEIRFAGIDEPMTIWLDKKRRMLDSNRQPMSLDVHSSQSFSNLLLRRLYFITSGLLSQDTDEHESEYEEGPNFMYRRAHFTVLRDPRYHMQSEQAKRHARHLLEQFNIDLKREKKRRQDLGIIPMTAHLTFTRESVPDVQARNIVPNVLRYNSDLVEVPLSES